MTEAKRGRGRPPTGEALSSTERAAKRDRELVAAGGRILRTVRLSPEATRALEWLAASHDSERSAIEAALIGWASAGIRKAGRTTTPSGQSASPHKGKAR